MTKYFIMIFGSLGYFIYLFIMRMCVWHIVPSSVCFELIAPILIAISAGLFLLNKLKGAGIFALIGLTVASRDILSNWAFINQFSNSRHMFQLYLFIILTTFFLFLMGFIAIKAILSPDKIDSFEIIKYKPQGTFSKIIGFVPLFIITIATILWLILSNIK